MENNQFDQWIKESLNQYTPKDVKPDWSAMKGRLQEADKANQNFDQSIREKLKAAETHIPGAEWQAYHQKQIIFRQRRRKILTTRVLESVIILLLIWTVDSIVVPEVINYRSEKNKIASGQTAPSTLGIASVEKSAAEESVEIKNSNLKNTKTEFVNAPKASSTKIRSPKKQSSAHKASVTVATKEIIPGSLLDKNKSEDNTTEVLPSNLPAEESSQSESSIDKVIEAPPAGPHKEMIPDGSTATEVSDEIIKRELIQLETLSASAHQSGISIMDLPVSFALPGIKKMAESATTAYWIQGFAGGGINFIATPKDVHLNLASRNSIGSAYVGGLSVLFDHQRWLLETGVTYAFLSNKPGIKNIYGNLVTGYFQKRFVQANYSLIDLPVLIHLKWLKSGPWEMSSSGGMSITACVDTRFDFVKETADKNSTQGISNIPKESLLDNKSYIHGLTQDDSFSDNSFANLILGSRLTYVLRPDMNVFTNVQFKRMLNQNGFGPNADKYNQLLWSFGILKRL